MTWTCDECYSQKQTCESCAVELQKVVRPDKSYTMIHYGYDDLEIQNLEWLDDEMAVGFVMVDERRWKVVVTKNEYCKQCDGKGWYLGDLNSDISNDYGEMDCKQCGGTGVEEQ